MGSFVQFYRKHFGGAESTTQLYLGFALFLAGFVICSIGAMVFLAGDILFEQPTTGVSTAQIKLSGFLLLLGLPLLFYGVQMTLPSRKVIHLVAGIGAMVCLGGAYWFNGIYPQPWLREPDLVSDFLLTYLVGLVVIVLTTGLALIFNFISRHTTLPGHELDDIFADTGREPTMEEILADIEREVSRQNLSWGGVEDAGSIINVLKLKADFGEDAYVHGGSAGGKVTITSANDDASEAAYNALMEMRGRRHQEGASDDDTQTAVAALVALRQARQAELERSWWYRFKRWLVNLFVGRGKRPPEHLQVQWKKAKPEEPNKGNAAEKSSSQRHG